MANGILTQQSSLLRPVEGSRDSVLDGINRITGLSYGGFAP